MGEGGAVDVWAVRLPAAVSALACVLFLYLLGVCSNRPRAGVFAGLILASCLHFTWLARVGRIDMPLTMTITFALGGFYLGNLHGSRRWYAFAYVSMGLGLLLKGPIAFVLPAVVGAAAWLLCDRRVNLRGSSLWWGIPLTLTIAAPWYVWANLHTDNQLWEVFFWYHNVERGLGGSEILKAYPWWFYGPQAFLDLLPWSLAVPVAVSWFIRNQGNRKDDAASLGLIWFGAIALFLSCMSFKRADYLLPAYPGMAIFLGVCADRWFRSEPDAQARDDAKSLACVSGSDNRWMFALIGVMLVYASGWLVYNIAFLTPDAWPYRAMAQEIRRQTPGPVIFFRAESHPLMLHLGRPVDTILEWENLAWWVNRPMPIYFVMPKACADEWRRDHPGALLDDVLEASDYVTGKHDAALVVVRSRGKSAANP